MTSLSARKSKVKAVTDTAVQGKLLVVELEPLGINIRKQRQHDAYFVPWSQVYVLGAELAARAKRAEKGK